MTAQPQQWKCGPYTVRQALRPDSPAWPQYQILRNGMLVGLSFSVPDENWCRYIERLNKLGRSVDERAAAKTRSYWQKDKTKATASLLP